MVWLSYWSRFCHGMTRCPYTFVSIPIGLVIGWCVGGWVVIVHKPGYQNWWNYQLEVLLSNRRSLIGCGMLCLMHDFWMSCCSDSHKLWWLVWVHCRKWPAVSRYWLHDGHNKLADALFTWWLAWRSSHSWMNLFRKCNSVLVNWFLAMWRMCHCIVGSACWVHTNFSDRYW